MAFTLHPPPGVTPFRQRPARKTNRVQRHRTINGVHAERTAPSEYRIDDRDLWLKLNETTRHWDLLTADTTVGSYSTSLETGVGQLVTERRVTAPGPAVA